MSSAPQAPAPQELRPDGQPLHHLRGGPLPGAEDNGDANTGNRVGAETPGNLGNQVVQSQGAENWGDPDLPAWEVTPIYMSFFFWAK